MSRNIKYFNIALIVEVLYEKDDAKKVEEYKKEQSSRLKTKVRHKQKLHGQVQPLRSSISPRKV